MFFIHCIIIVYCHTVQSLWKGFYRIYEDKTPVINCAQYDNILLLNEKTFISGKS